MDDVWTKTAVGTTAFVTGLATGMAIMPKTLVVKEYDAPPTEQIQGAEPDKADLSTLPAKPSANNTPSAKVGSTLFTIHGGAGFSFSDKPKGDDISPCR